jgi:hypothetical protein
MGQIGCAVLGLIFMGTMIVTAIVSGNWNFALVGIFVLAVPLYRGYRQVKQQAQRQRATTITTAPTPASPQPTAPPDVEMPDIPHQIRKLAELRDAGALTTEEFERKKAELLERK